MKIIGKGGDYSSVWIAEITQEEIRKVMDYAYESRQPEMKVGVEINLAQGYDFRNDIQGATRKMIEANQGFKDRYTAMMNFATMVANQPSPIAGYLDNTSDEALRAEWVAAGGGIHGPIVETVTMSEAQYFEFRRRLAR